MVVAGVEIVVVPATAVVFLGRIKRWWEFMLSLSERVAPLPEVVEERTPETEMEVMLGTTL